MWKRALLSMVLLAAIIVAVPASALREYLRWSLTGQLVGSPAMSEWFIAEIDQAVKLSDEQKKKMQAVCKACDKELDEFYKQAKPQLEAAGEKSQELRETLTEAEEAIWQRSYVDLMAVLTDEQKAAWRKARLLKTASGSVSPATLSDEQITQLMAACADLLKDDATLGGRGFHGEDCGKIADKVRELLTDEQKAFIEKEHMLGRVLLGYFSEVSVTDEQRKLLADEYDSLQKAVPESATRSGEIKDRLVKKTLSLLTEEQKDIMLALRLHWRKAGETDVVVKQARLTDEQKKHLAAARDAMANEMGGKGGPPVETVVEHYKKFLDSLKADQKNAMLRAMIDIQDKPVRIAQPGGMPPSRTVVE